jgi:regulator of nonsense transcripts 1
MQTNMYDARDAAMMGQGPMPSMPPGPHNQLNANMHGFIPPMPAYYNNMRQMYDPPTDAEFARISEEFSYINQQNLQFQNSFPVPMGMFLNMSHIPSRFFNQPDQQGQQNQGFMGPGQQGARAGAGGPMTGPRESNWRKPPGRNNQDQMFPGSGSDRTRQGQGSSGSKGYGKGKGYGNRDDHMASQPGMLSQGYGLLSQTEMSGTAGGGGTGSQSQGGFGTQPMTQPGGGYGMSQGNMNLMSQQDTPDDYGFNDFHSQSDMPELDGPPSGRTNKKRGVGGASGSGDSMFPDNMFPGSSRGGSGNSQGLQFSQPY